MCRSSLICRSTQNGFSSRSTQGIRVRCLFLHVMHLLLNGCAAAVANRCLRVGLAISLIGHQHRSLKSDWQARTIHVSCKNVVHAHTIHQAPPIVPARVWLVEASRAHELMRCSNFVDSPVNFVENARKQPKYRMSILAKLSIV